MLYPFRVRTALTGVVALIALLTPSTATAQAACNNGGRYQVRPTPSVINFGIVSAADLDAGQIVTSRMRVRVRPRGNDNPNWTLCLRAETARFGPDGKSIDTVEWQIPGSAVWQPVSTGSQIVDQGTGTQLVDVLFRVLVGWEDQPGKYSAPLAFLASSQ